MSDLRSPWLVRLHLIQRILLLGVALSIPCSLSAQNGSVRDSIPDWPRFLGKTFDGVAAAPKVGIDWAAEPTFLWSSEVGDGYGIGTVADGRYFQFDAVSQSPAMHGVERLRCMDVTSGKVLWTKTQPFQYQDMLGYEGGPRASPSIEGDRVITMGVTGLLSCRNADDGKLLWSVETNQKYGVVQNFFGVGSSPLVLGDRVIVMVGGSPAEDQNIAPMRLDRVSANGSAVVALDLKSGKQLWKCGQDLASYSSPRPIVVAGETLVLIFARSGLMAIDPEQGQVRWQFEHRAEILESVNAMMPVVDSDHVFISECYEVGSALLRVDANSWKVIWQDPPRDRRRQSMRCHWATPILVDGYLYGCSGRNASDSDFRCIDFQTGELQWSDPRRIRSSVTRVGDHLIVLEERGLLQLIKANPQQLEVVAAWDLGLPAGNRPALKYPCWSAPIVVGTKLLLRGTDQVICLELVRS
jgi:outer membrane protein assembly factor BamB